MNMLCVRASIIMISWNIPSVAFNTEFFSDVFTGIDSIDYGRRNEYKRFFYTLYADHTVQTLFNWDIWNIT